MNRISLPFMCVFISANLQFHAISQTGWQWSNPKPQGNTLRGVAFADSNTIVGVGNAGTILRSTDRGDTWSIQNAMTYQHLNDVCFGSSVIGFAVGDDGVILRTKDGGST